MSGSPSDFDLSIDGLIDAYARGPARLREVLSGLDEALLSERPFVGKWSALEIAVHLADSEVVGSVRLRQAFAQPGATFPFYDQDVWAELLGYRRFGLKELADSLDLFAALRATTVPLLRRAQPSDWAKTGFHPERGPMSLRDLLENYADHSERHIGQILRLREALGVGVEMPLLLENS